MAGLDPAELLDAPHCPRCHYGVLYPIGVSALAHLLRCFNCGYQESALHQAPVDPDTGETIHAGDVNEALGVGASSTAIDGQTDPSGAGTVAAAAKYGLGSGEGAKKGSAKSSAKGGAS